MTRGEWAYYNNNNNNVNNNTNYHSHSSNNSGYRTKWWHSYKKITMIVCGINILVALYILQSQSISLLYTFTQSQTEFKYTSDQIRNMKKSTHIRKALEPTHLIRLVRQLKPEVRRNDKPFEIPERMKNMITNQLLLRLQALGANAELLVKQKAVESWRVEKLREAKEVLRRKTSNSSISFEEAGLLVDSLGSNWPTLSEGIGFWVPVEVDNTKYVDLPKSVMDREKQFIPRLQLPPECKTELHTDYGGDAVTWGLTHHKESAYECCMACLDQNSNPQPNEQKCNIWVYCPSINGCHSHDMYQHEFGECWLKHSEKPKLNFKNQYPDYYRKLHPEAPSEVPWMAGFVTP